MLRDLLRDAFEMDRRDGFAPGPGASFYQLNGLTLAAGQIVFVSDWPTERAALVRAIESLITDQRFRDRQILWRIYDGDAPGDLAGHLEKAGFQSASSGWLMGQDIRSFEASELSANFRIEPVRTAEDVTAFEHVLAAAFEQDPDLSDAAQIAHWLAAEDTTIFLAHLNDQPVGCGILDYVPGRQISYLRAGGVLPDFRRRGIYSALVEARLLAAKQRGASFVYSDAGAQSHPRLQASGFEPLARETLWTRSP